MKKFAAFLLLFSSITATTPAQTTEEDVKAVINKMFTAMHQSDGSMLQECFTDSAILQTIGSNGKVSTVSLRNFINMVNSMEQNAADERIKFDAIHTDSLLASVWTPYRFYYKGQFSHCGVNVFQLVRVNDTWKIQYLVDTRRKTNCIE